jgi:hypothetical protein
MSLILMARYFIAQQVDYTISITLIYSLIIVFSTDYRYVSVTAYIA